LQGRLHDFQHDHLATSLHGFNGRRQPAATGAYYQDVGLDVPLLRQIGVYPALAKDLAADRSADNQAAGPYAGHFEKVSSAQILCRLFLRHGALLF